MSVTLDSKYHCRECLEVADPAYDLDYTDVEPNPEKGILHFCSNCGPFAHMMNEIILEHTKDPVFAAELEAKINEAEISLKKNRD